MIKNKLLIAGIIGTQTLGLTSGCQKKVIRPNFVFIIADDVSWDDIGCYGNVDVKTPNIDSLAANGLRFTNFFLTASSSSPSRNSIMTGRYPHNTGAAELHTEPPEEMVSLAEVLRNSGYYTAQAGKFHMGNYARRGFDQTNENGKLNGDGGEELWLKVLKERPHDKQFFMWFASYDGHRPWGPNELSGTHDPLIIKPPFYLAGGEKTKSDLAKYYDEIARLDYYIGLVKEELKKQKVLKNTVIIIMADNGRPFPHSKTRVNDRGLKTPFIVYWPEGLGLKPKKCNSLVSAVDIGPTILDLASVEIPPSFQGYSFVKLLNNPGEDFRKYVFAEHNWHDYEAHERMVRTKNFLYILNSRPVFPNLGPADVLSGQSYVEMLEFKNKGMLSPVQSEIFLAPRPAEELYECDSDPGQFINIAATPGYNMDLNEMRKILRKWMLETGDNIPENLTKDWYQRGPGTVKTENYGIRGEPVSDRFNATVNNSKSEF